MKIDYLKNLLNEFENNVRFNHDLKKKNWFNIGGKSKVFYKAETLKDLINFLKKLENKEKIFILGAGSNTLISDNLFNGVVIKLSNNFKNISLLDKNIIIAGSAVLDKTLSEFAIENNLSGNDGLLYSSISAVTEIGDEKIEGDYYVWDKDVLKKVLGKNLITTLVKVKTIGLRESGKCFIESV